MSIGKPFVGLSFCVDSKLSIASCLCINAESPTFSSRLCLSIELQCFYGTNWTASMLSSIEKCQGLKIGIEWPKESSHFISISEPICMQQCSLRQDVKVLLTGFTLFICRKNTRWHAETGLTMSMCTCNLLLWQIRSKKVLFRNRYQICLNDTQPYSWYSL